MPPRRNRGTAARKRNADSTTSSRSGRTAGTRKNNTSDSAQSPRRKTSRMRSRSGSGSLRRQRSGSRKGEVSIDDFGELGGFGVVGGNSRIEIAVPRQSSFVELESGPRVSEIDESLLEVVKTEANDALLADVIDELKPSDDEDEMSPKNSPDSCHSTPSKPSRHAPKRKKESLLKVDIPPLASSAETVAMWSEEEVAAWMSNLKFKEASEYGRNCITAAIDGKLLLDLDYELLQDLGITQKIHLKSILSEIKKLRTNCGLPKENLADISKKPPKQSNKKKVANEVKEEAAPKPDTQLPNLPVSSPDPKQQKKTPEPQKETPTLAAAPAPSPPKRKRKKRKKPLSDNYSMHDFKKQLNEVIQDCTSIQEKASSNLILFKNIPQLLRKIAETLEHMSDECENAAEIQKNNDEAMMPSRSNEAPADNPVLAEERSRKRPIMRQASEANNKLLKKRGQRRNETFTQRAFVEAAPFADLNLKFNQGVEMITDEIKIEFASAPYGFLIGKNANNQFGAVVNNIIDNSLVKKGLKVGYIISKVGHMDATKRSVHEVHSLISSATPPIEMTFCPPEDLDKLQFDPFEDVMSTMPYPTPGGDGFDLSGKIDEKTKLPNHRAFLDCGQHSLREKLSTGSWCMILINIDNMKILTQRYGQQAGEIAVRSMAKNILKEIKKSIQHHLFFHLYSDNFALLVPTKKEDLLYKQIDSIRSSVSRMPIEIPYKKKKRKRIKLSISGGFCNHGSGIRFNEWKKQTENALKTAKSEGKNRISRVKKSAVANKWSKELFTNVKDFIGSSNSDFLIGMAQRLLNHGATLNYQDEADGKTAVMLALQSTDKQVLELLLEHPFDANLQDQNGRTCLMYALEYDWDDSIVLNLLQRPFKPEILDNMGSSTLTLAMEKDRQTIVASLIQLQGNRISPEQAKQFPQLVAGNSEKL